MRPLIAKIDLAALKHNFSLAQQAAPGSKNFAVIKADAYGHGAVQCAMALQGSADGFAVASVEEAVELRQAGINRPILVLSAFSQPEEVACLVHHGIMPVIHSLYQFQLLAEHVERQSTLHCWLKVDSGMNRLGLTGGQLTDCLEKSREVKTVNVVGLLTHFASSDETGNEFTRIQINQFSRLTAGIGLPGSLANSCAIMAWPESHRDWNRPGIMLYGTSGLDVDVKFKLKPVMHFLSQIISVKTLKKGETVGYGQTFRADRTMQIGLVACGYADGYPRSMPSGGPIIINRRRSTILGRVSMDTLCIDATAIPGIKVGSQVELWGGQLLIREVAEAAQTIPYELLTRVSRRVPRVY